MKKILTVIIIFIFVLISCNKGKPECYSRSLEKQYKNKLCATDCPGITGCDDKFYCNECDANKQGIKIK